MAKKITKKAATKAKKKIAPKKTKSAVAKNYKLAVGGKIPSLSLTATGQKVLDPGALKGKNVVLYFYPKDNTPGCTTESQDFARLHADFKKLGTEIWGVSRDSLKSHEGFKQKFSFPFELVSDPEEKLCKAFDVIQPKKLYGREYMGIERSTFVIDAKGVLRQAWRKVQVTGHAEEVLEFIKSLDRA